MDRPRPTPAEALRSTDKPMSRRFPGTIAFAVQSTGDIWHLATFNGLDTAPQPLSALDWLDGNKSNPVFSPDGWRLLFFVGDFAGLSAG